MPHYDQMTPSDIYTYTVWHPWLGHVTGVKASSPKAAAVIWLDVKRDIQIPTHMQELALEQLADNMDESASVIVYDRYGNKTLFRLRFPEDVKKDLRD